MMQIELSAVNGHTAIEQEGMVVKVTERLAVVDQNENNIIQRSNLSIATFFLKCEN